MRTTQTRTAAGIVLDSGALITLDRGDKRMIALLQRALARGRVFRVPAGVVSRGGARCGGAASDEDQDAGCDYSGDRRGGGENVGDSECEGFSEWNAWGEGAV